MMISSKTEFTYINLKDTISYYSVLMSFFKSSEPLIVLLKSQFIQTSRSAILSLYHKHNVNRKFLSLYIICLSKSKFSEFFTFTS
jgi:hypothetical protein